MVFIPIRLRNQIWDKYHFSGTQLWLRAHGSAEKNNNRAWCARCMDHFERYWNICAKPACDRVHPVAVVTASSRISQNSRAGWPTVLHQRAPPCEGRPMFIHPDEIGRGEQQPMPIWLACFAVPVLSHHIRLFCGEWGGGSSE